MDNIQTLEINAILTLADTYRLTNDEIQLLNKHQHVPISLCEYYKSAYEVITWRSSYANMTRPADLVKQHAELDGCTLLLEPIELATPEVSVPVYCLGL